MVATLKSKMRQILLDADPMGIYSPEMGNVEEYDHEIAHILTELPKCQTAEQVEDLVVTLLWLGYDSVGPPDKCIVIANKIWELFSAAANE